MEQLYETKLAPFLTQTSHKFWKDRLWYFTQGLYYQGGMVRTWYNSIDTLVLPSEVFTINMSGPGLR